MLLVLQIAQYEAVALEVKTLLLVLFWTVFRIMLPGVNCTDCAENIFLSNVHLMTFLGPKNQLIFDEVHW